MRFSRSITIDRPRDVVWRAFTEPALRSTWDARLRGAEHLSGMPGHAGAISRLEYALPWGRLRLVETIVRRVEPEELVAVHAGESLGSRLHGTLRALPGGRTAWVVRAELHLRGCWVLLTPIVRVVGPCALAATMHRLRRTVEAAPLSAFPAVRHRESVSPE